MQVAIDREGAFSALEQSAEKMLRDSSVKGLLILACEKNGFDKSVLDPWLDRLPVPVIGGIFPNVVWGQELLSRGSLVVGLEVGIEVYTVGRLSDPTADYDELLEAQFQEREGIGTMLVLVDGLSHRIASFIDSLYYTVGLQCNYIGGGAGALSSSQRPCLMTNMGLIQDSAVLARLDTRSGVGAKHGWNHFSGSYEVTGVEDNKVKTLDWRPAFEVYRAAVEAQSGKRFEDYDFIELALNHPLGVDRIGTEVTLSSPLSTDENGALTCVGEIPLYSYVDILNGDVESLVQAAGQALEEAESQLETRSGNEVVLLMDGISRSLCLREDFAKELAALNRGPAQLVGALVIGEIGNNGMGYPDFHNNTTVVGLLEEL